MSWEQSAADYRDDVERARSTYHEGRLATAERLLAQAGLAAGARIVDFGCGGLDLIGEGVVIGEERRQFRPERHARGAG